MRGPFSNPIFRVVAYMLALASTGPAVAGVLPLAGAFGNEAGCAFFLTGKAGTEMALVTGDSLTSPAGNCDFVNKLASADADGLFVVEGACDGIGGQHDGLDRVTVELQGDAGVFVLIEETGVAGPLLPCPGAEDLLSQGVRI